MPTVTINRKVVEEIMGKSLPDDKLKDRISMLGTDLESVTDEEIVVEIFPNRPDMLSEQGFGRALSSFLGIKTGLKKYEVKKSGYKVIVDKSVGMRPYTACAIIRNIDFTDEKIREIMQMQEKLAGTHGRNRKKSAYGVYPIKDVKFPIKYIAKDPKEVMFRPLGFPKEMPALKVEKVHPTGKKYKHIADKWKEDGWKKYPFFIDANNNAMCMLPYTNSDDTGKVELDTKEVFIECTGINYENIQFALNMFVTMFADMGADIYSLDIVYPDKVDTTPNLSPQKMKVNVDYVNKLLGLKLKEKDLKLYLERMGFDYKNGTAYIPAYRADIIHPSDLAEDVAIAYGYENFTPEIPKKATTGQEDQFEKFRTYVSRALSGLNILETSSYHLTNEDIQFKMMNIKPGKFVSLANSLSVDYNIMRHWMLPNLMKILGENTHNEYPQNIFESGYIFKLDNNEESGAKEINRLAAVLCNPTADYTRIRQVLDYLLRSLGLEYQIRETEHGSFIPGRAGRVSVEGVDVAYIGEIHPKVLGNFEIEMPAAGFELNLSEIFKILNEEEEEYVKQGDILVSTEVLEKVPDLFVKSEIVKDVDVREKSSKLEERKEKLIKKLQKKKIDTIPGMKTYKEYHKKLLFGKHKSAVESILTRYISKGKFPSVNTAVDAGNIISVESTASIGLFDKDKIVRDVYLRFSKEGDEYLPYGQKTKQKIKPGTIILQDSEKIFAVIGVKDSIETSVDKNTKNLFAVTWGTSEVTEKRMEKVLDDFEELVKNS